MEIRRSYDRLISTMGFPILVRWHLYIESKPRTTWLISFENELFKMDYSSCHLLKNFVHNFDFYSLITYCCNAFLHNFDFYSLITYCCNVFIICCYFVFYVIKLVYELYLIFVFSLWRTKWTLDVLFWDNFTNNLWAHNPNLVKDTRCSYK